MKAVGARVTELVKERLTAESEGLGDKFVRSEFSDSLRIVILTKSVA
jgi:hypothetical protein